MILPRLIWKSQYGIFTTDHLINEAKIANKLTPSELVVFFEKSARVMAATRGNIPREL